MTPREFSPSSVAEDAPPFEEPWQAQAFAMVLALHERGLFTWTEWAEALGRELARPEARTDGTDYYHRWLAALEAILRRDDLTTPDEITEIAAAWHRAAHATPHGKPITLDNDPEKLLRAP